MPPQGSSAAANSVTKYTFFQHLYLHFIHEHTIVSTASLHNYLFYVNLPAFSELFHSFFDKNSCFQIDIYCNLMYNDPKVEKYEKRRYAMKQSQSSLLRRVNEFLTYALRRTIKFLRQAKRALRPTAQRIKKFLSTRNGKLIAIAAVLVLVLIIGLTRCTKEETPAPEARIGTVATDILDVYKKPNTGSTILGQIPLDLEVAILEEKSAGGTLWGRIGESTLPSGKTVGSGWIDLQCIDFTKEPDYPVIEAEDVLIAEQESSSVLITMGTITASKLNIRTGPGSNYDTNGAYYKGDRVEILETQFVDDTTWGRTAQGWIGTGYVRMDGTYTSDMVQSPDPNAPKVISDGNTQVLGYGIVTISELNMRLGPKTVYGKAGSVTRANRHAYYQLSDGWARLEDGWVSTEGFYIEGTATSDAFHGVVNSDSLNIRTGPKTSHMQVGTYTHGEVVEILAKYGDWGCTDQGWVYLQYIDPYYATGSATITRGLNIRVEPNADSDVAGTYTAGDEITIIEVQGNWGRTNKGWINLSFVKYDSEEVAATTASTLPATTEP